MQRHRLLRAAQFAQTALNTGVLGKAQPWRGAVIRRERPSRAQVGAGEAQRAALAIDHDLTETRADGQLCRRDLGAAFTDATIASDTPLPVPGVTRLDLSDISSIATFVLSNAASR